MQDAAAMFSNIPLNFANPEFLLRPFPRRYVFVQVGGESFVHHQGEGECEGDKKHLVSKE
ncbi:MAG: hypothetical protein FD137_2167 [Spirochaetes bacterium]|nr:MAG: hypothetical protein FD137_2167 [Spirochaetota bacterium]